MCTVSHVRGKDNEVILTSNRDEMTTRPAALTPQKYHVGNKSLTFPKDPLSGGTWFVVEEGGLMAVLLNGAVVKHTTAPYYRKSRGLILLDITAHSSPLKKWDEIDLRDIEPFTIILVENGSLYQLVWNDIKKVTHILDSSRNYIWFSATLYTQKMQKIREQWFADFLQKKIEVTGSDMITFHQHTEKEDTESGLLIARGNNIKTLSITQGISTKEHVKINYLKLNPKNELGQVASS